VGSLGAAGAALAAAAFAVAPAAVTPRVPLTQVPLADVVDVLPLDVQGPALYVLVVDTSASMQESGAYPAVAAAITDVLGALEPTDRVSVVTFDAAPRQCGAGVFPASDPAMITACLPPAAEGEYTDVGRAFEQVLTVLETTPAAVRTVVLISDGAHEPGPGSAYPAGAGEGGEGWRRLADRARTVRDVSAYSLPLSGADDGAASLGAVFASPTVLQAASPDEVRAALGVPPAAARRTEARSILAPDAMAGIEVEAPSPPDVGPEPVTWEVTLRSAAAHVPWTVRDLTLVSVIVGIVLACIGYVQTSAQTLTNRTLDLLSNISLNEKIAESDFHMARWISDRERFTGDVEPEVDVHIISA
jgi:hypothetical protein